MNDPILFYSAAAIAAAFLVYFGMTARRAWLHAKPRRGSAMTRFGENIRLRDLFRLAVLLEEEGRAFYLKLAERAAAPAVKELCLELAGEERVHYTSFMVKLRGWRPLPPNLLTWPAFIAKVKAEGLFADAPADGATEDELAAFAIRQEQKTAEFYRMFEAAFPETWKRDSIGDLVTEELSHEARLRALYPHLP